jgi:hypothetical protein
MVTRGFSLWSPVNLNVSLIQVVSQKVLAVEEPELLQAARKKAKVKSKNNTLI